MHMQEETHTATKLCVFRQQAIDNEYFVNDLRQRTFLNVLIKFSRLLKREHSFGLNMCNHLHTIEIKHFRQ